VMDLRFMLPLSVCKNGHTTRSRNGRLDYE
jgi:hypothetical protein